MKDASFVIFIEDELTSLPNIRSRRMFGGWGLYSDDTFFAIIADDTLFFKTNEKTRKKYIELGSLPFKPSEKQTLKNYLEVPAEILDDKDALVMWAEEAIEVSR